MADGTRIVRWRPYVDGTPEPKTERDVESREWRSCPRRDGGKGVTQKQVSCMNVSLLDVEMGDLESEWLPSLKRNKTRGNVKIVITCRRLWATYNSLSDFQTRKSVYCFTPLDKTFRVDGIVRFVRLLLVSGWFWFVCVSGVPRLPSSRHVANRWTLGPQGWETRRRVRRVGPGR